MLGIDPFNAVASENDWPNPAIVFQSGQVRSVPEISVIGRLKCKKGRTMSRGEGWTIAKRMQSPEEQSVLSTSFWSGRRYISPSAITTPIFFTLSFAHYSLPFYTNSRLFCEDNSYNAFQTHYTAVVSFILNVHLCKKLCWKCDLFLL